MDLLPPFQCSSGGGGGGANVCGLPSSLMPSSMVTSSVAAAPGLLAAPLSFPCPHPPGLNLSTNHGLDLTTHYDPCEQVLNLTNRNPAPNVAATGGGISTGASISGNEADVAREVGLNLTLQNGIDLSRHYASGQQTQVDGPHNPHTNSQQQQNGSSGSGGHHDVATGGFFYGGGGGGSASAAAAASASVVGGNYHAMHFAAAYDPSSMEQQRNSPLNLERRSSPLNLTSVQAAATHKQRRRQHAAQQQPSNVAQQQQTGSAAAAAAFPIAPDCAAGGGGKNIANQQFHQGNMSQSCSYSLMNNTAQEQSSLISGATGVFVATDQYQHGSYMAQQANSSLQMNQYFYQPDVHLIYS